MNASETKHTPDGGAANGELPARLAWLIDRTGDPYADTVFGRYAATKNGAAYLEGRLLCGTRSNSTLTSATEACQEDYAARRAARAESAS